MQNVTTVITDSDIINQVIEGQINAFESLITKYGDFVSRIVKKHIPCNEIEDVTQNAFIRIFQSLPMYKGTGEFRAWLSSITVRTCYDYWRKAYKSREIPMNCITEDHQKWLENAVSKESLSLIHDKDSKRMATELLEWALGKLSAEDRMILELIYLEGRSGREVADLLGWSIANVKVRSFRLRKKLKSILNSALNR
ncbi:MAG: RNA polymerase sigma factor [Deltaproteobacteria bacterium]|nr:RNA polymerase sigma factor [Deltaproteobacteria bacterium]